MRQCVHFLSTSCAASRHVLPRLVASVSDAGIPLTIDDVYRLCVLLKDVNDPLRLRLDHNFVRHIAAQFRRHVEGATTTAGTTDGSACGTGAGHSAVSPFQQALIESVLSTFSATNTLQPLSPCAAVPPHATHTATPPATHIVHNAEHNRLQRAATKSASLSSSSSFADKKHETCAQQSVFTSGTPDTSLAPSLSTCRLPAASQPSATEYVSAIWSLVLESCSSHSPDYSPAQHDTDTSAHKPSNNSDTSFSDTVCFHGRTRANEPAGSSSFGNHSNWESEVDVEEQDSTAARVVSGDVVNTITQHMNALEGMLRQLSAHEVCSLTKALVRVNYQHHHHTTLLARRCGEVAAALPRRELCQVYHNLHKLHTLDSLTAVANRIHAAASLLDSQEVSYIAHALERASTTHTSSSSARLTAVLAGRAAQLLLAHAPALSLSLSCHRALLVALARHMMSTHASINVLVGSVYAWVDNMTERDGLAILQSCVDLRVKATTVIPCHMAQRGCLDRKNQASHRTNKDASCGTDNHDRSMNTSSYTQTEHDKYCQHNNPDKAISSSSGSRVSNNTASRNGDTNRTNAQTSGVAISASESMTVGQVLQAILCQLCHRVPYMPVHYLDRVLDIVSVLPLDIDATMHALLQRLDRDAGRLHTAALVDVLHMLSSYPPALHNPDHRVCVVSLVFTAASLHAGTMTRDTLQAVLLSVAALQLFSDDFYRLVHILQNEKGNFGSAKAVVTLLTRCTRAVTAEERGVTMVVSAVRAVLPRLNESETKVVVAQLSRLGVNDAALTDQLRSRRGAGRAGWASFGSAGLEYDSVDDLM